MTENRCNTVLVAYSALPKIMKEYDAAFDSRLKSSFSCAHLRQGVTTEQLIGEMLEINRKKAAAILLKDTVEKAFGLLPSALKSILVLRFLKGMTFQEIAEHDNISVRTAFRRFDRARECFSAALDKLGLDQKQFEKRYLSDPAIACACARLEDSAYFTAKSMR